MSNIKFANNLLSLGDYTGALEVYRDIQKRSPFLADIVKKNINYIEKKLRDKQSSTIDSRGHLVSSSLSEYLPCSLKIAVVFHVYHEQIVNEILSYIDHIKYNFDLFITTPFDKSSPVINLILQKFPSATYVYAENKGRDILPFLKVFNEIKGYDLCLKLHTKQGITSHGNLWRDISLQSLLKSPEYVSSVIDRFNLDSDILIAGPDLFYLSGRHNIFKNSQNLFNICSNLEIDFDPECEWAFFAGTMFWFRPRLFEKYIKTLLNLEFDSEQGKQDGAIEHSLERIFGLIPSIQRAKTLLLSANDESSINLVSMPEGRHKDDPNKILVIQSRNRLAKEGIIGDINIDSSKSESLNVEGWLASRLDKNPRSFILKIGNKEFAGVANIYRSDLESSGINDGFHSFDIKVPLMFADGREYSVALFDVDSGLLICEKKHKWKAINRAYTNFSEYLSWSYSGQYVPFPFTEEDKRAFSIMELIANDLSSISDGLSEQPLVSVVMPTFNRASFIERAVNSVLQQKYKNWELLIVDDCSTDDTNSVVTKFNDYRVKYYRLPINKGVSAARNYALNLAKGEYIAYLDSDNDWDNRYLSAMIGAAKSKLKDAKASYCGQLVYSGKSMDISGVRFGLFNKSLLMNNNFIDLNCFIHKRILSSGLPLFDEDLERFVDWDFIIRISDEEKIASIPVILSNYYNGLAENSITANKLIYSQIDKVREKIDVIKKSSKDFSMPSDGLVNGISIVIPSYEAKSSIEACLESIEPYLSIKGSNRVDLIIVDNKSSPDVLAFLRQYAYSRSNIVTLIELDKNYGFTYAVNRGISAAKNCNDVLILNNDALLTGAALFSLQKALYDHQDYGVSVPAQILLGGTKSIQDHVPYALPEFDVDVNVSVHHKNLRKPPMYYEGGNFEVDFAPFFCALIKASTLKLAPKLDELNGRHYRSDRTYCEYIRVCFGLKILYCPNALVYHGLQKSTFALNKKSYDEDFKNIFILNSWSKLELDEMGLSMARWSNI